MKVCSVVDPMYPQFMIISDGDSIYYRGPKKNSQKQAFRLSLGMSIKFENFQYRPIKLRERAATPGLGSEIVRTNHNTSLQQKKISTNQIVRTNTFSYPGVRLINREDQS